MTIVAMPSHIGYADEGALEADVGAAVRSLADRVGISTAEATDRISQQAIIPDLAIALLEHPDIYGFRLDEQRSRTRLVVTVSPSATRSVGKVVAAQIELFGLTDTVSADVTPGRYEAAELDEVYARVADRVRQVAPEYTAAFEIGRGTIEVVGLATAERSVAEVEAALASAGLAHLANVTSDAVVPAALAAGGESLSDCTAGFAVTNGTTESILTAGHCGNTQTLTDTSQGGNDPVTLGVAFADAYTGSVTVGGATYHLDRQLHQIPNPHNADAAIRVAGGAGLRRAVTGVLAAAVGVQVCKFGRVTAVELCNPIDRVYAATEETNLGGVLVRGTATAEIQTARGDSGGPVYQVHPGGSARAVGIVQGLIGTCLVSTPTGCDVGTRLGFTVIGRAVEESGHALLTPMGSNRYNQVAPARILDTRVTGGALAPNTDRHVDFAGAVPADAVAVVVNVTALNAGTGLLRVYPRGDGVPAGRSISMRSPDVVPQLLTVPLGTLNDVTLRSSVAADAIVDLLGYYADTGARLDTVGPTRAYDSRVNAPVGPLGPGGTRDIALPGVPAGAIGALINLTAVTPTTGTFLTAYRPGSALPGISHVNALTGQVTANLVMAPVNAGSVRIFNAAGDTHFIIDVLGYYSAAGTSLVVPVPSTRLRSNIAIGANSTVSVTLEGLTNAPVIPDGASGAILAITVHDSTAASFVSVTPTGGSSTSTVNHGPGLTVTNHTIVRLSSGGVRIYNLAGATQVDVDVEGYLYAPF